MDDREGYHDMVGSILLKFFKIWGNFIPCVDVSTYGNVTDCRSFTVKSLKQIWV